MSITTPHHPTQEHLASRYCHDHGHHHDHDHHHDHHHGHGHDHDHGHRDRPHRLGILLAAFGAAVPGSRDGYEIMEREAHQRFPGVPVRWAFTANKIRRKLAERGLEHDSVAVALSRLYDDGVTHLAVQSLHTVPGVEYHWTRNQAMVYQHPRKGFLEVAVGGPLLHDDDDLGRACNGLAGYIPADRAPDEAVVLVGHGTYHEGHKRYRDFELCAAGRDRGIFVGTLMGHPNCSDIIRALEAQEARRVHLIPFMSVPGHHVRVDICGDSPYSWKGCLEAAGYSVTTHMTGTLEHGPFREQWLDHLGLAVDSIDPGTSQTL